MFAEFFQYLLITITAIFVIVNPLTTAFAFLAMLPRATEEEKFAIAKRATIVATSLFFLFALLGSIIFKMFGITLSAFRIAGGIILFGIAMGMIRQKEGDTKEKEKIDSNVTDDIAIIPLAIPFISGPGSIATVMILTSEAPTIYHTVLVFAAILLTTATCFFAMIKSKLVVQYIGNTGKQIVTRLFGIILSVVAVQFVINGSIEVANEYLASIGYLLPED